MFFIGGSIELGQDVRTYLNDNSFSFLWHEKQHELTFLKNRKDIEMDLHLAYKYSLNGAGRNQNREAIQQPRSYTSCSNLFFLTFENDSIRPGAEGDDAFFNELLMFLLLKS